MAKKVSDPTFGLECQEKIIGKISIYPKKNSFPLNKN